jgi:hypothetical protein
MELAATSFTGLSACRGFLYVRKNGGSRAERGQKTVKDTNPDPMSGNVDQTVADGDRFVLELAYQRVGDAGNAARVQRARLCCTRLD